MENIISYRALPEVNQIEAMRVAFELEKYSEQIAAAHEETKTATPAQKELLNQIAAKSITLAITIRAIGGNADLLSEDEIQAALFTIAEGSNAVAAIAEALQEAA